jgi:hypothetical protein
MLPAAHLGHTGRDHVMVDVTVGVEVEVDVGVGDRP